MPGKIILKVAIRDIVKRGYMCSVNSRINSMRHVASGSPNWMHSRRLSSYQNANSEASREKEEVINRPGKTNKSTADFGFQDVDASDKERMVKEVFSRVAAKYDVMNDLMSLGTHRLWKDELVEMLGYQTAARVAPQYVPRHLDVAGGTGDVAFRSLQQLMLHYSEPLTSGTDVNVQKAQSYGLDAEKQSTRFSQSKVVVCDINPEMLEVGKLRAVKKFGAVDGKMLEFVEGNAEALPFDDDSFDLYTIAFGLRNVTDKQKAIAEAYRVLKTGGRMLVLEFSHVKNPLVSQLYDQFSFHVIPRMGEVVANDADSYQYLVESIRRFPKQDELKQMMAEAGFQNNSYTNYTFGVVAIHSGFKIDR